MLETLTIQNFVLIDRAEIPFRGGLNILSGETGAGKSIILEAISLILGSRAQVELIRQGEEEALVEGYFDLAAIDWMRPRLESLGFAADSDELLIRRTIHRSGKHRIHVNGQLATLALLQRLCDGLVDLCGQHEHQSLTRAATQLEIVDRYAGLGASARQFRTGFEAFRSLKAEIAALEASESERTRKRDFLRFQIQELREAALEPGEDAALAQEKALLQSAEARLQAAEGIRQALEDEEEGALSGLRVAALKLKALLALDERVADLRETIDRAVAEAENAAERLSRYTGAIDLDSERLEQVSERLGAIADLRRKYGATVEEMLGRLGALEAELSSVDGGDERLERLREDLARARGQVEEEGARLLAARCKSATLLADSVSAELKDLKMAEARFSAEITPRATLDEWTPQGPNDVAFLVQTNRGEPARPLGKIASGGELSRLMLAIRRVIADRGGIGVYLFDEIDAGIGGQTAFEVGRKLKSVARYNQVICITHLPQVASFADHHLVVRKRTVGKRTLTEVAPLKGGPQRKEELARMLGGAQLTRKSLENAAELLETAGRA